MDRSASPAPSPPRACAQPSGPRLSLTYLDIPRWIPRAGRPDVKVPMFFSQAPNIKSGLQAQNQRYGQRATPPPPAYRRRGLGRPPSGGRAAVSISSRPFLFFAGRRQVGQVASPPARSLSPARLESVFLREEPQPQPRSRAARAPRARLTRVRLAAGWPILCNKRRRGPPLAPPPPRRRPPALDPPAAPGQHPISTPLPTL